MRLTGFSPFATINQTCKACATEARCLGGVRNSGLESLF